LSGDARCVLCGKGSEGRSLIRPSASFCEAATLSTKLEYAVGQGVEYWHRLQAMLGRDFTERRAGTQVDGVRVVSLITGSDDPEEKPGPQTKNAP